MMTVPTSSYIVKTYCKTYPSKDLFLRSMAESEMVEELKDGEIEYSKRDGEHLTS